MRLSREHGYAMSFAKFSVLSTFGECLALRLVSGEYNRIGRTSRPARAAPQ